jgi:hypothetical protein
MIFSLYTAGMAGAATVSFVPGFSNNSLGEGASFTASFTFSGNEYFGDVDPATEVTVHLPAGVGGTTAGFSTCETTTLEMVGPEGCPPSSIAGPVGSASGEATFGGELVTETGTLQAFYAPENKINFWVNGLTPVSVEFIIPATYTADQPPYGQVLTLKIPPITTVPGNPDASLTSMTIDFGVASAPNPNVAIPAQCPQGGFPWAGDVRFEDGTTSDLTATSTCPGSRPPAPPPPPPPPCAAGVCAVAPTFGPQSGGTPITITGGPFVSGSGSAYMVCFKRVGAYDAVCTGATVVNGTTLRATTPPRPVTDSPGPYLISTEAITTGSGNLDINISPSNVTFDFDATYQAPGDASLAGTGTSISLTTPHSPGEQGYAYLQDANAAAVASDFHASIDWGDGTGTASATLAPVSIPGIAGTTSGTQTLSTLSLAPTTPLPNGSLFSVDAPAHDFANVAPGENEYDTWVTVTDSAGSFATMLTPVVITTPLPPHTQPVPHGPTVTVEGALKTVDVGHTLYDCGVAIAAGGGPEDPFADGACLLSMGFSLDIEAVTGDDPPDSRVTAIPGIHHVHVRAPCPRSRGPRSRQCRQIATGTQSYLSASEVTAGIALAQAESVDRFDTAVGRRNSSAAVLQRAVIYAYAGALLPAVQRQNAAAAAADRVLTAARLTAHVTSHELLGDYRRLSHRLPPGLRALQTRQHIPSLTKLLGASLRKLEGGSQTQLLAPTLPVDGIEQIADETTLGGVLQILSALQRQHAIATGDAASRLAGDIVSLGTPTSPALMQQFNRDLQLVQPAYRPLITGAVTALQDAAAHATPHLSPG